MENMLHYLSIYAFWYILICMFIPSLLLYPYAKSKTLIERVVFYQIAGNCYLVLCGFILSFLKIYVPFALVLMLIILPLIAYFVINRQSLWTSFLDIREKINTAKEIYGGPKLILRNLKTDLVSLFKNIYIKYLKENILSTLVLIAVIAFAVSYFGYYKINNSGYAYTDEETHLFWIQSLSENNPFPKGLYPHAMHFLVSAIGMISGCQIVSLWHFFNIFSLVLILIMAYFYCRVLFDSHAPAVIGVGFYVITNMFTGEIFNRFQYSLPMEFGLFGLFAMLTGLQLYIKHKDRLNLIMFVAGLFLTFQIHFYIAIFAAFICVAYGIVFLIPLIKSRKLHILIIGGLVAIALSLAPFVIGYLSGFEFERSIAWGIAILNGEDASETLYDTSTAVKNNWDKDTAVQEYLNQAEKPEKENYTWQTVPVLTTLSKEELYDFICTLNSEDIDYLLLRISEEEKNYLLDTMDQYQRNIYDNTLYVYYELSQIHDVDSAFSFALKLISTDIVNSGEQATIIYILALLALVAGIIMLVVSIIKKREVKLTCLVVFFCWLLAMCCYWMPLFHLPALLYITRAASCASMMYIPLFGVPVFLLQQLLDLIPGNRIVKEQFLVAGSAAVLGFLYTNNEIKSLDNLYYNFAIQNSDMDLCLDLLDTHEDFSWTVISPTNDLSVIRNNGYHYEIIDLLQEIEDGKNSIYIPTSDIYVVVEKRPINFYLSDYRKVDQSDFMDFTSDLNPEYVNASLYDLGINYLPSRDRVYYSLRDATMTKLYFWMEKFKDTYPSDYTIYSDNEYVTVYHIHQDPYFLINLALDYSIPEE